MRRFDPARSRHLQELTLQSAMSSQHGASQSGPSCGPKSADEMTLPLGNQGARDGGACCRTINGASSDTSSSILSGSSSPALLLRSRRGVSFRRPLRYDAPHGVSARSRHAVLSSPNSRPSSRELRRTVSLRTATADADHLCHPAARPRHNLTLCRCEAAIDDGDHERALCDGVRNTRQ